MNLLKAKTSISFKQYDSAIEYFKTYMNENPDVALNKEELNSLSKAYKYILNEKRSCIRKVKTYSEFEIKSEEYKMALSSLVNEMRNKCISICTEVIDIINENLLQNVKNIREKVLIYKMKGDYNR